MPTEGKWLIAGMLGLAFAAAAFGWYWNREASRRCLQFWGAAAAAQIAAAPQAELLDLASGGTPTGAAAEPADRLDAAGQAYIIVQRADVSHARGFGNVRRMLVQDASYDWSAPAPAEPIRWDRALRFTGKDGPTVVLLALSAQHAALVGRPGAVQLDPAAATILREFCSEQFRH